MKFHHPGFLTPSPSDPGGPPDARRGAILVVDDDAGVRQLVRDLLEREGYTVQEAGSGRDALTACQRDGFILVITDIMMPDMEGLELLRVLRQQYPGLPVVVITGHEMGRLGTLATIATRLGARQVYGKPLDVHAFVEGVRGLLRNDVTLSKKGAYEMYGTVARLRIKPGQEQALRALIERQTQDARMKGFVGECVYRLDSNPEELILVVLFTDRASYRANATSPEQDLRYRALRALLAADPEWQDGDIIHHMGIVRTPA